MQTKEGDEDDISSEDSFTEEELNLQVAEVPANHKT